MIKATMTAMEPFAGKAAPGRINRGYRIRFGLGLAVAALLVCTGSHANAVTLTFDWTLVGVSGSGTATGTLSLVDNATGSATNVQVISYPTGMTFSPAQTSSFNASTEFPIVGSNSFTVANGVVTADSLLLQTSLSPLSQLEFDYHGHSHLTDTTGSGPSNNLTSAGVTFTLEASPTTPVPEPASWALFGTGLLGLAAFGRQRRKSLLAH